jgi:hypothetical protein
MSSPARDIEFVTESQSFGANTNTQPTHSSETWKSVIGQQINLINTKKLETPVPGALPFWKIAEDSDPGVPTDSPLRLVRCMSRLWLVFN